MKKPSLILVCVVYVALMLSLASSALGTEWDVQYNSKLEVKDWFTDRRVAFGEIIIDEANGKWEAYNYYDEKIWHYWGAFEFINSRENIKIEVAEECYKEYKRLIKHWIKTYVVDQGGDISRIRVKVKKIRNNKPAVLSRNPLEISKARTICKGSVAAEIDGESLKVEYVLKINTKILNEDDQLSSLEQELIGLINKQRQQSGLTALVVNDALVASARRHSTDMAQNDFMSHTGSDGSSPWDRILEAGYSMYYGGENIAAGYSTSKSVFDGWMSSTGHRDNMLNPDFCDLGVGYAYNAGSAYRHYWTLTLGCQR